jgi:hypothetical protein
MDLDPISLQWPTKRETVFERSESEFVCFALEV